MQCLNIHLHSFQLSSDLVKPNDKVRVSITTFPERNKQAFIVDATKINNMHHIFSVNITEQTKKILFVFRRKNFINNDPIISSTIIDSNEFTKFIKDTKKTEPKFINLYEFIPNFQNTDKKFSDRRIIGVMKVDFSIPDEHQMKNKQENKNSQEYIFSKLNFLRNNENRNQNNQNMIFSIMLLEEN